MFTLLLIMIVGGMGLYIFGSYKIEYREFIAQQCSDKGIEQAIVYSVIKAESSWKVDAVSAKGAIGLMQLLPSTAQWLAEESCEEITSEDLFNPEINITLGITYLQYLQEKYDGNIDRMIAAYNAGEGNVDKWIKEGVKIQFKETENYLKKVRQNIKIYEKLL